MPQLGLGLGLHKNSLGLTPLQLLLKYTSAMWLPSKATGSSEGINSPFTNPLIDLKGVVGKNLLPVFDGSKTLNGITTTISNGEVTISGTSTSSLWVKLTNGVEMASSSGNWLSDKIDVGVGSRVALSVSGVSGSATSLTYAMRGATTALVNFSFPLVSASNITAELLSYAYVFIPSGATVTNLKFKIQLELGSVATAYEPYGKANLLLQGFAGTTSSGYVGVLCPNGKTVPFLQFDVTNDYGLASNPSLEILGTSDFGFGRVIKVPSLVTYYPFTKSESSEATTQYGLKVTNTGILSVILEGTTIQLATGLLANTVDAVWVERISGVLKCFINGAEVFSVANTTSLTSRPNFRVGALSTNVGGTTHTGFSNEALGSLVITKTEVLKARLAWFKFTLSTFGI